MTKIAIMGCGWLGLPLAENLLHKGHLVHGSTTSTEKEALLKEKGIRPFLITLSEDGIMGDIRGFLTAIDALIINVPPKLRGPKKENYVAKMRHLHGTLKSINVPNVIFVSSTSVYGDLEGEITEATLPRPTTESGRQLLEAETLFTNDPQLRTTVIRFGGLIGPDRHPVTMLSGKTDLTNGGQYVNLIHLNDCIRVLELIIAHGWWNELFNGVYPLHPAKAEYYTSEAFKRGIAPPVYKGETGKKGKKVLSKRLKSVKMVSFETSIHSEFTTE